MTQLQALLSNATAGDPVSGMRWTHKSLRKLAKALQQQGHRIGAVTVGRLLKAADFSLRTNRKRLAHTHEPERDRQFRRIARLRQCFAKLGNPALSIDTKKKELLGLFKNPGVTWRQEAIDVLDHDFASEAVGRAIPFGIYDLARNSGFVVVGTTRETAAFAGAALRCWWDEQGKWRYPRTDHWLLLADCGGANNVHTWLWKWAVQQVADYCQVRITVAHYPPGASKWNPIEHRLFSAISSNWQGEPLRDHNTVVSYIANTTTETGLRCRVVLDTTDYPKGQKLTADQRGQIQIRRSKVLPQWNYTIWPHKKRPGYF